MTSSTTPSLTSKPATTLSYKENILNESNQPIPSHLCNHSSLANEHKATKSPKSTSASSNTLSSTKPSLTSIKSRNELIQYALSKHFKEDSEGHKAITHIETVSEITNDSSEYEDLIRQQERDLPVPIVKKDDEKFKLLKMKSFKRTSVPFNKSVRKSDNDKADKTGYEKEFDNTMEYSMMKKRRVSHSTKKTYTSALLCYTNEGEEVAFPIYIDKDIGIYEYWQAHIIESKADEDVMTDKEQLGLASAYIVSELREAIETVAKEGHQAIANSKNIA